MNRRNFIRVTSGGVIAAAGTVSGCSGLSSTYPAEAVEAWQEPAQQADPRRRALAYAITAPNPHNLQPWLVDLREADVITLHTDVERVLPETDPFGRQIMIGHGAFLELLVMALAQQGLASRVVLWPQGPMPGRLQGWDQRPVARIFLTPAQTQTDPLFAQVLRRHTPKAEFDPLRQVTADTLHALTEGLPDAAVQLGASVTADQIAALRELCRQAGSRELLTPRTMMESQRLMRVGPAEILAHRDGISLNTAFIRAASTLGLFDRSLPPARGSAAYKAGMALYETNSRTAMGFIWLSTAGNSRSEQIAAGRSYVRLQLKATALGVGMHPMSQALQEFAEMQPNYESAHQLMLGRSAPGSISDPTLQMFCRLGYPLDPVPATPRRRLEAFVQAA